MQLLEPKKIVLIGASTGGPGQITKIIAALPALQTTSIIIAQHMADGFIESFAHTLATHSINSIEVAQDKKALKNKTIYLCQKSLIVKKIDRELYFFSQVARKSFNPDINLIFDSFTPLTKELEILTVILTGIGNDGVEACKSLSLHGSQCITETSQSAIIDGMPGRAREMVKEIRAYDIDEIIKIICEFCE